MNQVRGFCYDGGRSHTIMAVEPDVPMQAFIRCWSSIPTVLLIGRGYENMAMTLVSAHRDQDVPDFASGPSYNCIFTNVCRFRGVKKSCAVSQSTNQAYITGYIFCSQNPGYPTTPPDECAPTWHSSKYVCMVITHSRVPVWINRERIRMRF